MAADEDACSAADGGSCAPSVEDASAAEASTQQLEAMLDNGASAEELDAVLGEGTVLKPAPESATESAPTPPTAEELAAQAVALRKAGEYSFMYRYILRESCSQFDSLPLTYLTFVKVRSRRSTRFTVRRRASRRMEVAPR